jgi:hypothetical protein
MKYAIWSKLLLLAAGLTIIGCGGKKETQMAIKEPLPEKFAAVGAERSTDVSTYSPDSLWQYIDGGADQYLDYGFREVKTAEYRLGNEDIVVDVFEFSDATNAYGLYSVLRPEEPDIIDIGVEGYVAPASVEFVKANRLVRLVAFDESNQTRLLLVGIAKIIAESIEGTADKPPAFNLFPIPYRIASTDKYIAKTFLGHAELTKFYTQDYGVGTEAVTLFLTLDDAANKFQKWSDIAEDRVDVPEDLEFDDNKAVLFRDGENGMVLFGMKSGKLIGAYVYNDTFMKMISEWLTALEAQS